MFDLLDKCLTNFKILQKLRCNLEFNFFFFLALNLYYLHPIPEGEKIDLVAHSFLPSTLGHLFVTSYF